MLFNVIRIVIWLVISVFTVTIIRKSKIVRKKFIAILTIFLCMLLVSVSAMFPVENLFINFKSPERVFHYAESGNIDEIIYGKDSCMVIYSKANSTVGTYIIPKVAKGYNIPSYFATENVFHQFDEKGIFDVYHVKGTHDCYIFATVHLKEKDNVIEVYNEKSEKVAISK